MPKVLTTRALVLKTYDIGNADRFCILLTEARGRVAAVARGVRKPGSTLSGGLQSFQELTVDLAEHSSGLYLRSAVCLESFPAIRTETVRFLLASRGAEILLQLLHDSDPDSAIFFLARDFFLHSGQTHGSFDLLLHAFQILLLRSLGLLPTFHASDVHSPALVHALQSFQTLTDWMDASFSPADCQMLEIVSGALLREHLLRPLRSEIFSHHSVFATW